MGISKSTLQLSPLASEHPKQGSQGVAGRRKRRTSEAWARRHHKRHRDAAVPPACRLQLCLVPRDFWEQVGRAWPRRRNSLLQLELCGGGHESSPDWLGRDCFAHEEHERHLRPHRGMTRFHRCVTAVRIATCASRAASAHIACALRCREEVASAAFLGVADEGSTLAAADPLLHLHLLQTGAEPRTRTAEQGQALRGAARDASAAGRRRTFACCSSSPAAAGTSWHGGMPATSFSSLRSHGRVPASSSAAGRAGGGCVSASVDTDAVESAMEDRVFVASVSPSRSARSVEALLDTPSCRANPDSRPCGRAAVHACAVARKIARLHNVILAVLWEATGGVGVDKSTGRRRSEQPTRQPHRC